MSEKDSNYELNQRLDRLEKDGMAITESFVDMWTTALQYFFGEQLQGKKHHRRWEWVVLNYIWPTAMQEMAKLTKNPPKIITHPGSDDDTESAEAWRALLQWMWEYGLSPDGMRWEQMRGILDSKLFGYRVSKVCWEDRPRNGWDDVNKTWVGNVEHTLVHPAMFWASADCEKIEKAQACGTSRWVRLEWAQKRWPKFKDELEQAATEGQITSSGGSTVRGARGTTGSAAAIASGLSGGDSEGTIRESLSSMADLIIGRSVMHQDVAQTSEKIVKISEIYFLDETEIPQREEADIPAEELVMSGQAQLGPMGEVLDMGGMPIQREQWPTRVVREWDEPKYPYGRYVVRCEKVILNPETRDEPYAQRYPYKQWPFIVLPHYLLPHMWQGINAVEMYRGAQDWINVSVSYLGNHLKMCGLPQIAVEDNAMSMNPKTRKAYDVPTTSGGIIRLLRGGLNRFKRLDPAPLSPAIVPLYNLFTEEFKNLTGMQAVAMGQQERHRMTATESEHLLLNAHDRISLQSAMEDIWIVRVARLAAEIAQARYEVGRIVRIVGQEHTQGVMQISQRLKDVDFDVDIEAGSTLPYDEEKRIQKFQIAYQLLNGPPNPMLPLMLRTLEVPNWKELLMQHQAYVQFMQFMQMQQAIQSGQVDPAMAAAQLGQQVMQMAPPVQQGGPTNA